MPDAAGPRRKREPDANRLRRRELIARALLTLGALLPYAAIVSFAVLPVADDSFTSDIFNGELPLRVLTGEAIARGELPVWSDAVCGGVPLMGPFEPMSLALFALLPPAAAICALLLVLIQLTAHGTYALARQYGTSHAAAVLAGLAFAGSGYFATQLRHLSIITTIAWFPLGLLWLDRALGPRATARSTPRRAAYLCLFGLTLGAQHLAGFPQTAYYCGLTYGAYALYLSLTHEGSVELPRVRLRWLLAAGAAACVGTLAGAATLLPVLESATVGGRTASAGFEWATTQNYWAPNVLNFLIPYVHGDVSEGTYQGPASSVFWEDYGYVGLATVLLAFYAAVRTWRARTTRFFVALALIAYLFVLGRETPVYRIAYDWVPGLSLFRFSTRFLVLVDFALALLAAFGLSRLTRDVSPAFERMRLARLAPLLPVFVCAATALDLFAHQARQNPFVPADAWLAEPATVAAVKGDGDDARVFTPYHKQFHRAAHRAARGWSDLRPYHQLRELAPPNLGLFWDVATADCYVATAPAWHVEVWGDHMQSSKVVYKTLDPDTRRGRLDVTPAFLPLMQAYGVTHVISPLRMQALEPAITDTRGGHPGVYRVPNTARARMVPRGRITSDDEARALLVSEGFDPSQEVLLHEDGGAPIIQSTWQDGEASAAIERADPAAVVVRTEAPQAGYLVLADTFYPDWSATVDGQPAPILRANMTVRAVPVPAGKHQVRFRYEPTVLHQGMRLSLAGWVLLLVGLVLCVVRERRGASS
jgi:hypothetical protein